MVILKAASKGNNGKKKWLFNSEIGSQSEGYIQQPLANLASVWGTPVRCARTNQGTMCQKRRKMILIEGTPTTLNSTNYIVLALRNNYGGGPAPEVSLLLMPVVFEWT